MKIVVAGGSGFIGEPLVGRLIAAGHDVSVLTRNPAKARAGQPLLWDGRTPGAWSVTAATADVVINLAGESIGASRWTASRRESLYDSRIGSTRALVAALRTSPERDRLFISTSAVGYYGLRGDEVLDESSARGSGFLADLSAAWEEEARGAEGIARTVILRFGVVIGPGGALAKMLLPFRLGLGGRIGSGDQWMSWVSREDVVGMIEWVIGHEGARGVYNVTAPQPVRNRDFTASLGRVLHRPTLFPVPALAMKIAFGRMGEELLLSGQRVFPARATESGFRFQDETIVSALQRAVR